jgi:GH15 family glucan-1,4-alpha-glucosidase
VSAALRGPDLELGVIGNCEVAGLIDPWGRLVWACLPRLDGDPAFCALLTPEGGEGRKGVFAIDLQGQVDAARRYLRNTAVLETILRDGQGNVVRIVDFCPRFRPRGRIFRPMMFIRIVEPLAGRPAIRVRLQPATGYGEGEPLRHSGTHNICFFTPQLRYRVTSNASRTAIADADWIVLDRELAFVIGPDETLDDNPLTIARRFLDETTEYWQDWVRSLAIPIEWQEAVIRSAITLKLCTYEDSGAVVAALTTSIPEHANSSRNWDYRYCWLRDSYFVIQALNRLGATRTMEGYLRYIDNVSLRSEGGPLQPLYGIGGEMQVTEWIAPALPGYRGMGPVRVGNLAYVQRQNDVYGAVVLAAAQTFFDQRLSSPGDLGLFQRLERLGERAASLFALPDAGPWEFRGMERTHTFSAAMCWAGCDRLQRIAHNLGLVDRAAEWGLRAGQIREQILGAAWNERHQAFAGSFGGDDLDATTVLLPELGIVSATDPRFLQTLAAVERELKRGDWLFRYRHQDDFGTPVTAFTICAFWYINALAAAGRVEEAREQFQRLLERRNSLGLLSEDIDPVTGELWGNFPQTYSLVGIVNCAVRLSRPWEDVL